MITQRITNCDIIVSRHEHFRRFLNEETPDRDLLVVWKTCESNELYPRNRDFSWDRFNITITRTTFLSVIIFCCSPKFLISGIREKPNYFFLKNSERLRFFFQIREAFRSIWKPSAELVVSRKFLLASTTQPAVSVFVSDLWQVENDGKCYKRLHINLRTFSHLRGQNLSSRSQTAPLYSKSFRQKNYAHCFCVGILIIRKGHKLIFSIYPHMEIPIFQWIFTDSSIMLKIDSFWSVGGSLNLISPTFAQSTEFSL